MSKKNTEEDHKARPLTSTNSDRWHIQQQQHCTFNSFLMWHKLEPCISVHNRLASESLEADLDVQLHCSSSSEPEPEKAVLRAESPSLASAFALSTSFEEDVLDLKWRQSHRALLCPPTPVLSPLFYCFGWFALICCFLHSFFVVVFIPVCGSPHSSDKMGAVGVKRRVCVRLFFASSPSAPVCWVFVLPRSK